jgi:hypothetical protein
MGWRGFLRLRGNVLLEQQTQAAMRMPRSTAAPAAAKTTSTAVVVPPRRADEGDGDVPLSPEPLPDDCSGGGRVLAGDDDGAPPWDLAGSGGGEGPPELDGEGEDELSAGGDEDGFVDGGGADEGGGLLFGRGWEVDELDDMAWHEKTWMNRMSVRGHSRVQVCASPPLRPPRPRGSATDAHVARQRSAPHGTRMPAAYFIPPPSHLTRGENSRGRETRRIPSLPPCLPCLLPCFCFCCVLLCSVEQRARPISAGGWCLPHLHKVVGCETAGFTGIRL